MKMLEYCLQGSGVVCYYQFFLAVVAFPFFFLLSLLQYRQENRFQPNPPKNLLYYCRRVNIITSFGLVGFLIRSVAQNPWLFQLGEFFIANTVIFMINELGLSCHYCIKAAQEMNRLPSSRFSFQILLATAAMMEIALVVSLFMEVLMDQFWSELGVYVTQLISLCTIPIITLIKVKEISKAVLEVNRVLETSGTTRTLEKREDKMGRFKRAIFVGCLIAAAAIAVEALNLSTAIQSSTQNLSWAKTRPAANPFTISIQVVVIALTSWYTWISESEIIKRKESGTSGTSGTSQKTEIGPRASSRQMSTEIELSDSSPKVTRESSLEPKVTRESSIEPG